MVCVHVCVRLHDCESLSLQPFVWCVAVAVAVAVAAFVSFSESVSMSVYDWGRMHVDRRGAWG